MKISVIVPIYNAEKYLSRCLDSILNQSYEDIELILVNDGSTDRSLEICREYENQDKRVIVLDTENSGPGVARNRGMDRVTGEYIAFVDADDYIEKTTMETLIKIAIRDKYEIVSSSHYRVDKEITVSNNSYKTGEISRDVDKEQTERYSTFKTSSSFGYVWGKIYKTSFIKQNKIKFSDERQVFLEDTLFNLKAISYNPKYYVLNKPLYYYNVYEDSLSNKKEDITDRAIKMLEDYEEFLDANNTYDENQDLFIPLATRTIAWSLFKTMKNNLKLGIIYNRAKEFSYNKTIRRLCIGKRSIIEIKKIRSLPQQLLYILIILSIRYRLEILLSLTFYLNYNMFKIYIKKSLKA